MVQLSGDSIHDRSLAAVQQRSRSPAAAFSVDTALQTGSAHNQTAQQKSSTGSSQLQQ
jgi:hypothetical protein